MVNSRAPIVAAALGCAILAATAAMSGATPVAGRDPATAAAPSPRPTPAGRGQDEAVTLSGRLGTRTDADGRVVYTLTSGGVVYDLETGPRWWAEGDARLKQLVGRTVTIEGERSAGSRDVDVLVVDGARLRSPGRPPWAGGPKVIGERHPGWKAWKDGGASKAEEGSRKPAKGPKRGPHAADSAQPSKSPGD